MSERIQTGDLLAAIIDDVQPQLLAMGEAEAIFRANPERWSKKEVLGHLIDSASNNHQRFVRAQFVDHLVFSGYDQESWVSSQGYQSAEWRDLIRLWYFFNIHLARVINRIPEETRQRQRSQHNLHRIAWQTVAQDQPVTLEYFMKDYVRHLEHHLQQILVDYQPIAS